jgi:hypothetical protein
MPEQWCDRSSADPYSCRWLARAQSPWREKVIGTIRDVTKLRAVVGWVRYLREASRLGHQFC